MWIFRSLLIFVFSLSCCLMWAQTSGEISIGQGFGIRSEILGENRRYRIHLPDSYDEDWFYSNHRYPVMVLLDGDTHFHSASGMVDFMSNNGSEQIPEMIVVAVSNTDRTRDMTPTYSLIDSRGRENQGFSSSGGADVFLSFLEQELLPHIDSSYRTIPYRVLVGHSFGGLFAVHAFLERSSFQAYLAIDPSLWWDEEGLVQQGEKSLLSGEDFHAGIYIAHANNPFESGIDPAHPRTRFGYLLSRKSISLFTRQVSVFRG